MSQVGGPKWSSLRWDVKMVEHVWHLKNPQQRSLPEWHEWLLIQHLGYWDSLRSCRIPSVYHWRVLGIAMLGGVLECGVTFCGLLYKPVARFWTQELQCSCQPGPTYPSMRRIYICLDKSSKALRYRLQFHDELSHCCECLPHDGRTRRE